MLGHIDQLSEALLEEEHERLMRRRSREPVMEHYCRGVQFMRNSHPPAHVRLLRDRLTHVWKMVFDHDRYGPFQLVFCPWCGEKLADGASTREFKDE